MPDGILSDINLKLLTASTAAEKIKQNATQSRSGVGAYENAQLIINILDAVMKEDLHNLRKENERKRGENGLQGYKEAND